MKQEAAIDLGGTPSKVRQLRVEGGVPGVRLPNMTLEAGVEVKGGAMPLTSYIASRSTSI